MEKKFKKESAETSSDISLIGKSQDVRSKLFERQMLGSFFGNLFIATIFSFIFWESEKNNTIFFIWLITILFFISFRLIQGYHFLKTKPGTKKRKIWESLMSVYTIGAGTAWGISPYVLEPETIHELVFTTIYACGLIAAAVVSLSGKMRDFLLFSGSIAFFMVSFHLSSDYQHSDTSGYLFIFYFLITCFFARNVGIMQNEADQLLQKNTKLIDKLIEEKDNAERSNKEKTRFIANASHDLRQPLHALGLYLDSLDSDKSIDEKADILKKSKQSLKSLDDLFSSLLDISNIDAGVITISPLHFKLSHLLDEIIEQVKGAANEKQIELNIETDEEMCAFCDPVLSGRCLRNIIINAIQHADCSEIMITTIPLEDEIMIRIRDNGKGIAEENLSIIFEEFQQLNNPQRDRKKGLGLGLTIVKRLLSLQGHEFGIDSSLGVGTTFKIYIPYGNNTYISDIRYKASKVEQLSFEKSILIIDDEKQILDGMGFLLSDWKQDVALAASIDEAVDSVKSEFDPNIIISDYRLQNNATGADAINALIPFIKKNTQIVFISGETDPQKINEIRKHGYPLIHKPVMGPPLRSLLIRLDNNPDQGRIIEKES